MGKEIVTLKEYIKELKELLVQTLEDYATLLKRLEDLQEKYEQQSKILEEIYKHNVTRRNKKHNNKD